MNFIYAHNVDTDTPIMLINKHIGYDENDGQGIDGAQFQKELIALDGLEKKSIQIWINSVGGLVMDGYNIINAIQKTKTPVDTLCVGMAASIAAVIFQAGRKRIMSDYGILMYHNPYSEGVDKNNPLIEKMKDSLTTIICERSGMSRDDVDRMLDRETYIDANEALQMKLCDSIESSVKLNTKYYPKNVTNKNKFWNEANKVINKYFNINNMQKVANKLGLNDDASENSILAAISALENKAKAAEEEKEVSNKKNKEELDKMKEEMDEMKEKYNKMKEQYDKAKAELDEAEDKAKEEKAKACVKDYVSSGRIKNEEKIVAQWVAKLKEDFEGTKSLLDSIPVNKKSVTIPVANSNLDLNKQRNVIATAMAEISAKLERK
jgi:ATP-dependent Clp protease protease subunit